MLEQAEQAEQAEAECAHEQPPNAAEPEELCDPHVRRIVFPHGKRVMCLAAAMALGKSTAAKRFIVARQPKRVLVVTARRQQAHTALGELRELGFVHYQQATVPLACVDRLTVQYESLHHLMMDDGSFRPTILCWWTRCGR